MPMQLPAKSARGLVVRVIVGPVSTPATPDPWGQWWRRGRPLVIALATGALTTVGQHLASAILQHLG